MATDVKTLRFRRELRSEIDRLARRSRRSFSEVTQDLLEEALRMRKCPGIYFHDEPAGREAKIAGTGLGIWEVISACGAGPKNAKTLKKRFHWLSNAQIAAALTYYRAWPQEIDDLASENQRAASEVPEA
ncbi:MAG: hypothetical protein JXR96_24435 [Deltaproteobacteria bacterium]|nr:hypothetical protein [Deltaproteobacteria bacterium]